MIVTTEKNYMSNVTDGLRLLFTVDVNLPALAGKIADEAVFIEQFEGGADGLRLVLNCSQSAFSLGSIC